MWTKSEVSDQFMDPSSIPSKFAPIFAIKASALSSTCPAKPLNASDRKKAWDRLQDALPSVLSHCSGFTLQAEESGYPSPVLLWDFLNGRSLKISVNRRYGYDLFIKGETMHWNETRLSLELLLLKLIALDYTPEEFDGFVG